MLDRTTLAAIARRYDTAMSRAMLRALGVPRRGPARPLARRLSAAEELRYEGLGWCFENHGSPMDALR